jgi:hypothetical protein
LTFMATQLSAACAQFEAVVLRQVLTAAGLDRAVTMNNLVREDGDGDDSKAHDDVFGSLVVGALADAMSRAGGLGLARQLELFVAGPAHAGPTAPATPR